jgi:uncharacterized protein (DUF1697 family)
VSLVVFLRGVNVGGHRTFRPTQLAAQLRHLDAVNIGAAGTFLIRQPIGQEQLRAELARRLPFDASITICRSSEIVKLASRDPFAANPPRPDIVRFVSVLPRQPRPMPALPMTLSADRRWLVKVLACDGRFVLGVHRRHMKVIGCLGALDRVFGMPLTTRNWNTIVAIAARLAESPSDSARMLARATQQ